MSLSLFLFLIVNDNAIYTLFLNIAHYTKKINQKT